jgi:hypothetical protein
VTPITIATNQAGRPVHVGQGAYRVRDLPLTAWGTPGPARGNRGHQGLRAAPRSAANAASRAATVITTAIGRT